MRATRTCALDPPAPRIDLVSRPAHTTGPNRTRLGKRPAFHPVNLGRQVSRRVSTRLPQYGHWSGTFDECGARAATLAI